MRRASITFAASVGTLALALLAGCSMTDEADPAVDPDETGEATAPEAAIDPTDPACLIGDWRITQEQMQSFYDAVGTEGVTLTIEGDTGLSFTADTYLYTPSFVLKLDLGGVLGEGVTTGSIGGPYSAADGVITTTVGDNSLSTIVTINGVTQDASSTIGAVIASDPINQAPFDCSDPDAPVLQFDTGTNGRTPVALTRAG